MSRNGGLVELRDSDLGCSILHGLEWMVAEEGEESRPCLFVFMRMDGCYFSFRNFSFSSPS